MAYDPYKRREEEKGGFNKAISTKEFGDVKFIKFKSKADASFAIVPYKIGSKLHPAVAAKEAEIGDEAPLLDFYVHKAVGPNRATVVCPAKTWGQACPICAAHEAAKRDKGWDSPEAKALKPKRRVIYNVVDLTADKMEVKLFEESDWFFGKPLAELAESTGRRKGKPPVRYADPDEQYSVDFSVTIEKYEGHDVPKYSAFSFGKMDDPLPKKILDAAIPLDKLLVKLSTEELEAILYGGSDDDEEEEDEAPSKPSKPIGAPPAKDDDDEPEHELAGHKCPVKGRKFAHDFDKNDEVCQECQLFTECRKAWRELD